MPFGITWHWRQDVAIFVLSAVLTSPYILFGWRTFSGYFWAAFWTYLLLRILLLAIQVGFHFYLEYRQKQFRASFASKRGAKEISGLSFIKGDPVAVLGPQQPGIQRVFVLEFWATWCKPCVFTAPHLSQIAKRYQHKEIYVIGITNETNAIDRVTMFVQNMGDRMAYSVAIDMQGQAYSQVFTKSGAIGIPSAVIFSVDGEPVWTGHPMNPEFAVALDKEAARTSDRLLNVSAHGGSGGGVDGAAVPGDVMNSMAAATIVGPEERERLISKVV